MRIYLHIPACHLKKNMPRREVVFENFPMNPVEGMQVYVGIGDGTLEAPSSTALVEITKVRVGCNWKMAKEPQPDEDSYTIDCETSWVRVPGRRSRNG